MSRAGDYLRQYKQSRAHRFSGAMDSTLWVPSKDLVYELARVVGQDGSGNLIVETLEGGQRQTVARAETGLFDSSHLLSLDDLCAMSSLHEGPLLDMLRRRFLEDKIYTYSADVLVAVNPYKTIAGLYDSPLRFLSDPQEDDDDDGGGGGGGIEGAQENGGAPPSSGVGRRRARVLPPHVFQIADDAFQDLSRENRSGKQDQSIIISGESGAGKTEASKHAMQFLIQANESNCALAESVATATTTSMGNHMKQVLLHSSVVFEAFGNAKTVRNDNSSRFGKYIKLFYTRDNLLYSAATETFLLETSRLVAVGAGERNYHVFYQLLAGLSTDEKSQLFTSGAAAAKDFKILTEGGTTVVTTEAADAEEFSSLKNALSGLGCSSQELDALWSLLVAVLHLGNATAALLDGESEGSLAKIECSSTTTAALAKSLGVPESMFLDCLRTQTLKAGRRGSISTKILSPGDTQNNTAALLKYLYKGVFWWLLQKVNAAHSTSSSSSAGTAAADKFVGILDIFGFEILQKNSFEQLCINYTNERLQQQFNEHIFVLEQQEYASEGLNWASITYRDNQNVIELIGKKPYGLLLILEEHSMMNRRPDDIALGNSYVSAHGKTPNGHPAFSKSRFGNDGFLVRHFAGEVSYDLDGFISKNNDSLQDGLLELLAMSDNSFLRAATGLGSLQSHEVGYLVGQEERRPLPDGDDEVGSTNATVDDDADKEGHKKMASTITVSFRFREQLDKLTATLKNTTPHYIKCIKSNATKSSQTFTSALVLEQLRYSGVIEVVRIRREGYPSRLPFKAFYDKHSILAFKNGWLDAKDPALTDAKAKEYCMTFARDNLPSSEYQAGKTRMFLRDGALDLMQQAIVRFLGTFATKIQSLARSWLQTRRFAQMRLKVIKAQTALRMLYARKKFTNHVAERKASERRIEAERRRLEAIRLREEQDRLEAERLAKMEHEARVAAIAEKKRIEEALRVVQFNAAVQVQTLARKWIKKARIFKRAAQLHRAAATGDVATLKNASPVDLALLLRVPPHYRTLQHTALANNQVAVLKTIGWNRPAGYSSQSVLSMKDAEGNGILHMACMAIPVLKNTTIVALCEAADARIPPPKTKQEKTGTGKDKALVSSDASRATNRSKPLKAGWLSKRKEGNAYRRRWCILTQDNLSYYKQAGDVVPKGVVPLLGCTFRRVFGPAPDDGACFSLTSPHIKKPSFFGMGSGGVADSPQVMYFMADSEADLLQWIAPTR